VKKLLDDAYAEAKEILTQHRDQMDLVVKELLKHESLDGQTFSKLIRRDVTVERSVAEPQPK